MIDIETHQVIDLLPSREIKDVAEWLMTYPNLKIVSRDGSVSYNCAIKQANKNIQQVSDRFHLLKGLTDAAKQVITSHLTATIGIPTSASHYDGNETADYWEKEIKKDDLPTREHNHSYTKKKKLVEKVLELTEKGFNISQMALETGLSRSTVKRYQNPDYKITNGMYNTTLNSKIKPYSEKIEQMLEEKYTFKKIEEAIRKDGYAGSASTIRMYTTRERRRQKESLANGSGNTEKIERKWVISLLYKPIDKVKKISQEQLDRVIENHPKIGIVHDLVKSFKNVLFSKQPDELEKWLAEAEEKEMEQITSFVNGIRRDMDAVKNAILLDYNNGLAEGSVNKLKVIKRIMYGRNSFSLLKSKLLRLELKRKIN